MDVTDQAAPRPALAKTPPPGTRRKCPKSFSGRHRTNRPPSRAHRRLTGAPDIIETAIPYFGLSSVSSTPPCARAVPGCTGGRAGHGLAHAVVVLRRSHRGPGHDADSCRRPFVRLARGCPRGHVNHHQSRAKPRRRAHSPASSASSSPKRIFSHSAASAGLIRTPPNTGRAGKPPAIHRSNRAHAHARACGKLLLGHQGQLVARLARAPRKRSGLLRPHIRQCQTIGPVHPRGRQRPAADPLAHRTRAQREMPRHILHCQHELISPVDPGRSWVHGILAAKPAMVGERIKNTPWAPTPLPARQRRCGRGVGHVFRICDGEPNSRA